MSDMRYILALDTGGTKCQALLIDHDGNVAGSGYQEGRAIEGATSKGGSGRNYRTIAQAAALALDGIEYDQLIIANTKRMTLEMDDRPVEFVYYDEMGSALALADETWGVVALAGTGAFVCGITEDGRRAYLDGVGPVLGDYGSAYHVGYLALRAAVRSEWHPRHATSLTAAVRRAFDISDEHWIGYKLVPFSLGHFDRSEISDLSRLVTAAAAEGDHISIGILQEAGAALAETLFDVVDRLEMAQSHAALVGTGGMLSHSPLYWKIVCENVHKFAPNLRPFLSDLPPVVGIAIRALQTAHPDDWRGRVDHLLASARVHYRSRRQLAAYTVKLARPESIKA